MDLFDLVAKLSLDSSDYDKGLDKAEKNANGMGNKLKSAFGTATKAGAALAGGAVAAGTAIYGMATKSADTADHVDKMSQKIGISREAYQELDFICSQSGADVDKLRVGMKTLTNQMGSAATGTGKAAELFDKLGVSIYDSNGNMKDQETMLYETLDALQGVENQTERATIANTLFGKSGSDLMPLINGARGSIEEMREQAHELGLVLGDDTIDAGVKFTDTMDQMQRALSAMGTEVGAEVMPIVQEAAQFIVEHMPQIREIVSTVFGVLEGYVSWFVNAITTYIMPIMTNLIDFLNNVFSGDWSKAWESIKGLMMSVWDGVSGLFVDVFNGVKKAIAGEDGEIDWAGLGQDILDLIFKAFSDLTSWANDFFENAKTALDDVDWESVGESIWSAIKTGIGAIRDAFASLFGEGKDGVEEDIQWVELGKSILGFITSAFSAIKTVFTTIFGDAWKAIKEDINWVKLGENVLEFIKSAFSAIGEAFRTIFEKAWTAIKDDVDWAGLGAAILGFITGVFDGIGEGVTGVVDWFTGKFGEVLEGITGLSWEDMGGTILGFIENPFDGINGAVEWFERKFTSVLGGIEDIEWEDLGQAVFDFIKNPFDGINGAVKWFERKFTSVLGKIKDIDWTQLGKDVLDFITNPFDGTFSGAIAWFHNKFTSVMEEIKGLDWADVGMSIWNAIKDSISNMGSVFQASNLFKLPRIEATTFQVGPISIPDFQLVWEKKAMSSPLMFSNATLFGAGEAGDEMLYGHGALMRDISAAVANASQNTKLYDLLAEYLPEILDRAEKDIILDDGTLIGRVDSALGWNVSAATRGV